MKTMRRHLIALCAALAIVGCGNVDLTRDNSDKVRLHHRVPSK